MVLWHSEAGGRPQLVRSGNNPGQAPRVCIAYCTARPADVFHSATSDLIGVNSSMVNGNMSAFMWADLEYMSLLP